MNRKTRKQQEKLFREVRRGNKLVKAFLNPKPKRTEPSPGELKRLRQQEAYEARNV